MPVRRDATTADPGPDYEQPTAVPGVRVVWEGGLPEDRRIALGPGPTTFGRDAPSHHVFEDTLVSRLHVELQRGADGFTIRDLDSSNGVFVDGVKIQGIVEKVRPRVIRVGDTVLIPVDDIMAAPGAIEVAGRLVLGPATAAAAGAPSRPRQRHHRSSWPRAARGRRTSRERSMRSAARRDRSSG